MAIEEKDNQQNIKCTPNDIHGYIHVGNWLDLDITAALVKAVKDCERENKAQEILIVIDKGF